MIARVEKQATYVIILFIYIYSGIVVHGEGGISAPYLYIIDKKESDWLPVTAAAAVTYVR